MPLLLNAPPVTRLMLPSVQVAVMAAALSSRRPRVLVPVPLKLIPLLAKVVPVPDMVPLDQVNSPGSMVRSPAPVRVPPDCVKSLLMLDAESMVRVPLARVNASSLRTLFIDVVAVRETTVVPATSWIQASSPAPGTTPPTQFVESVHEVPSPAPFHTMSVPPHTT